MDGACVPARRGALNRWGILLLVLLAMGLVSAITLALQPDSLDEDAMFARTPRPLEAATRPGSGAGPALDRGAGRPLAWAETMLARPLFSPDRRPAAVAATGATNAPASLPRLAGILMDGPRRSVIFAAPDGARPTVVAEGGNLGGFHVQSVEAGQVTIVGPDGAHVLRPSFDPRPAAPTTPVPAPGLPSLQGLPGFTGIPGLNTPGPVAR